MKYFVTRIKICRTVWEISFLHSPSWVPYKKLPSLVLYVFTLPSFSSILCPLSLVSLHPCQTISFLYHPSSIPHPLLCLSHPHLSIFSSSSTFQSFLFILDKLTRIWLFLRWPWAFGLWGFTAIVDLFSTFISGCMIGDLYQLEWILSTTDRSLSWWMLSCLWWFSYTYARFLFLLQHVVWFFHSIFHLKKD